MGAGRGAQHDVQCIHRRIQAGLEHGNRCLHLCKRAFGLPNLVLGGKALAV
ncbi:hypothetical protein D3C71_2201360 [compost metagenome]